MTQKLVLQVFTILTCAVIGRLSALPSPSQREISSKRQLPGLYSINIHIVPAIHRGNCAFGTLWYPSELQCVVCFCMANQFSRCLPQRGCDIMSTTRRPTITTSTTRRTTTTTRRPTLTTTTEEMDPDVSMEVEMETESPSSSTVETPPTPTTTTTAEATTRTTTDVVKLIKATRPPVPTTTAPTTTAAATKENEHTPSIDHFVPPIHHGNCTPGTGEHWYPKEIECAKCLCILSRFSRCSAQPGCKPKSKPIAVAEPIASISIGNGNSPEYLYSIDDNLSEKDWTTYEPPFEGTATEDEDEYEYENPTTPTSNTK